MRSYNVLKLQDLEIAQFLEKRFLMVKFKNSVSSVYMATPID